MSIGKITSLIVILMTAVATVAASPAEAPRKSPPLKITKASGKEMQLASLKGKVVVVEFLFVRSPHCLHLVEMLYPCAMPQNIDKVLSELRSSTYSAGC
jgi:hypothetical protein